MKCCRYLFFLRSRRIKVYKANLASLWPHDEISRILPSEREGAIERSNVYTYVGNADFCDLWECSLLWSFYKFYMFIVSSFIENSIVQKITFLSLSE